MAFDSEPELLVLHSIRIQGMAPTAAIAGRFSLDATAVQELLLDFEAYGWVYRVAFADLSGWTLSEAGKQEGQRRLAAELDLAGARDLVTASHADFAQLNGRFLTLVTKWQIRPTPRDAWAANDHQDWAWDEDVLKSLTNVSRRLRPVGDDLSAALARFAGYSDRFDKALGRVDKGERSYVDQPKIDSCHTVWFELHEDLLATLGMERGG